jgi:Flp pilus assembly protein TadG
MSKRVRRISSRHIAAAKSHAGAANRGSQSYRFSMVLPKPGLLGSLRNKAKGQAVIIIALSMILLLACVGLAIDGGSTYTERRQAQNASDGAAMAGAGKMLALYQDMVVHNSSDVDGSSNDEQAIYNSIVTYAGKNGISVTTDTLHVYFVNDQKQIVTASLGANGCGFTTPCQVGQNQRVPWVGGAKGIVVTTKAQTDAYFMQLFGTTKISAVASATAYMGVATNLDTDIGLLPIGFFTQTTQFNALVPNTEYTLIQGSSSQGPGNWGFVDFNGNGNPAGIVDTWIACGYNPAITTATWAQYCPAYSGSTSAAGPTQYWTGMNEPLSGAYYKPNIYWPPDPNGWWIAGSSGTTNSTCQFFKDISDEIENHDYWIPVFDRSNGQGGNNTKFHLIGVAQFRITTVNIACHKRDVTPTPGVDPGEHWSIKGIFLQHWSPGASGGHGDVRHTSSATVFLEP